MQQGAGQGGACTDRFHPLTPELPARLGLRFDPERFELSSQALGSLALLLGSLVCLFSPLAFLFGPLVCLLGPLVCLLHRRGHPAGDRLRGGSSAVRMILPATFRKEV